MSDTIDAARVKQYKANIEIQYQQKASKLRGTGRMDFPTGKQAFFELLGPTEAVQITTRHQDTPRVDSQHSRRMATLKPFVWADLIDDVDKVQMLIDPASPYAINAASSLGRKLDNEIYTRLRGNAFSGEEGGTSVALPAAQKIAHGSAVLTLAKITAASRILNQAEVPMEDRVFVIEAEALEDLLNDTTITSADFNTVRLLMAGTIDVFMGFKWILYNYAEEGSTFFAIAYHKQALGIGIWKDVETRITELAGKNYSTQVFARSYFGATRIQDNGVVEIAYQT